jgi:glycosyltransferase involved in cell wall biosynthesis
MEPLVSILIPAYNAEPFIAATIRSALAQTWLRKEIIIVDDGSKDRTVAIARRFASKHVSVVTQANQGAAAARNAARSLGQGDFIQWLDADDLLSPGKIAHQMRAFEASGNRKLLLSGPYGRFYYRPERAQFKPSPLWNDLTPAEWLTRKMAYNCHMQTATWLVSRELTDAAGPWDTRLLGDDDGEYFCRVKMGSDSIKFVPEARVYYRATDSGSLSYIGASTKKQDAQLVSMRLHIDYLMSLENSERTRAACVTYLQKYMFDFCPERPDIVRELETLAESLGGRLEGPRASWKYAWIQKAFGWPMAKRAHILVPGVKHAVLKAWDKALFRLHRTSWPNGAAELVTPQ